MHQSDAPKWLDDAWKELIFKWKLALAIIKIYDKFDRKTFTKFVWNCHCHLELPESGIAMNCQSEVAEIESLETLVESKITSESLATPKSKSNAFMWR